MILDMRREIELAYLGIEVPDPASLTAFFGDVVGLVPGTPADGGALTWRNDAKAHQLIVQPGPANDAVFVGFEAVDAAAFESVVSRLRGIGCDVTDASDDDAKTRRVTHLARVAAPWGVTVEVVVGLEAAA